MTNQNFFADCATLEAIKTRYRELAFEFHPDRKNGDTETMKTVNAAYSDACKRAISEEPEQWKREQATRGFEPLREAIEFAVTLPDEITVTIRGFWLWLEGETRSYKDTIKNFQSSENKKFCWSPNKTAWYFAAVPSSNKGKSFTFDEIEARYGREEVTKRVKRRAIN